MGLSSFAPGFETKMFRYCTLESHFRLRIVSSDARDVQDVTPVTCVVSCKDDIPHSWLLLFALEILLDIFHVEIHWHSPGQVGRPKDAKLHRSG